MACSTGVEYWSVDANRLAIDVLIILGIELRVQSVVIT